MKALGCLLALGVYAMIAMAIRFVVERRVGIPEPSFGAGVMAAMAVWVGVLYVSSARRAFRDLRMIRRGRDGAEPIDGELYAAIGPITPAGRAMTSPITGTPAVAYSYQIVGGSGRWEGEGLVPSMIRCGNQSVRLLAVPELDFQPELVPYARAAGNAAEYIRATKFTEPDLANLGKWMSEIRSIYTDEDGEFRQDRGSGGDLAGLKDSRFFEKVVKPGQIVCVFGRYSSERRGLVAEPGAKRHTVRLVTRSPGRLIAAAAWSVGASLISATITFGLVVAALIALHALVPLDGVAKPSWREIALEEILDQRVRPRMAGFAAALPFAFPAGEMLQPGVAHGRVRTARGEAVITSARAEGSADGITVVLLDRQSQVGELELSASGQLLAANFMAQTLEVPSSKFVFRRIGENEIAGRLTWAGGGVHVVFRVQVAPVERDAAGSDAGGR